MNKSAQIKLQFQKTRAFTEEICAPLEVEDYVPQPMVDVSPPKWHLAHSTWFFEQFVLVPFDLDYQIFNKDFAYLFNSYYNNAGERVLRPNRGLMTRPPVREVIMYREYVTDAVLNFLESNLPDPEALRILELGINHEQQHQELLVYDIKYILGNQPTFPIYGDLFHPKPENTQGTFIHIQEGIYEIGSFEDEFCFDNECSRHKVFIQDFQISSTLVTNGEYLEFIEAGGYQDFNLWLAEGWDFIQNQALKAPLYWHEVNGAWFNYTLNGFQKVNPSLPVQHVSFYEAHAFATWKGVRLPTEFEWEVAADNLKWGQLWEWTYSAYHPYPGFKKAAGALGEYNGKFMVNQNVLRGASVATPEDHSRKTYRNFFPASSRWLFSGIRLAK